MTPADALKRRCLIAAAFATVLQAVMLATPGLPAVGSAQTSMVGLHLLLELASVTVCALLVVVSWHAQGERRPEALPVVVTGFTVVGIADLMHALTYEGMAPFLGPVGTERAIFFWLIARSAESVTLALVVVPFARRLRRGPALALGLGLAAAVVAWGSFGLDHFPTTFVPGQGVTPLKSGWELAICLSNLATAVVFWRWGQRGEPRAYLLAAAAWIVGVGELSFANYQHPSDFQNIFGHLYKLAGYALIYRVSFITNVTRPFIEAREARLLAEESNRRLRTLVDNLPLAFVYQAIATRDDRLRRYANVSGAVEPVTGITAAELESDRNVLRNAFDDESRARFLSALEAATTGLHSLDETVRLRHRDGRWRWLRIVSAPRRIDDDTVVWDALAMDVTATRTIEQRHRENERLLAAVIESASDAVVSTGPDGRITLFNPAAERIFGQDVASMLGQPLDRLLPTGEAGRHAGALAAFAGSPASSRRMGAGRVPGRRADGSRLELEASISQVTVGERQVLTAILRDVTERVRNERALLQSQQELTELARRLMEQERQTTSRLAQVLHDQLGQTLTAMRIDFVSEAPPADAALAARHARVDRLIDQAVREVRQVLVELRPTLLEERGLAEALRNEIETRQIAVDGVALRLHAAPALTGRRWNAEVEFAVFMVAREAVGNALRHAQASAVDVFLEGDAQELRVEVRDDGRGLADSALVGRPGHLGMVGMRERAIAIGARFEVGPALPRGTAVVLAWEAQGA